MQVGWVDGITTEVWVNDGTGIFTKRRPSGLSAARNDDICIGDVDADGDIDVFSVHCGKHLFIRGHSFALKKFNKIQQKFMTHREVNISICCKGS